MEPQTEEFPIITIDVLKYFPQLREIPSSPKTMRMRGTIANTEGLIFLGIVGSRKFSPYGKEVCESLIKGLKGYPICIVSGLALGIDGVAHRAALDVGLATIAFPGSGLEWDILYPLQHKALAQEILLAGGALFSEFKDDAKGAPWTFPLRNRLIAGICSMVIVIEAEERSGTLITARLGTEYNKIVGAVPGPITSKTSAGAHQLLKLGAVPITCVEDILQELRLQKHSRPLPPAIATNEDEEKILALLTGGPMIKEALLSQSSLDEITTIITLSTLEIKGLVRETLGLIERV